MLHEIKFFISISSLFAKPNGLLIENQWINGTKIWHTTIAIEISISCHFR